MRFLADLHIHSRYSIATSRDMTLEVIHRWAQIKGLQVIGTGDFTHPAWFSEIREKMVQSENGLFTLKRKYRIKDVPESCRSEVFFIPTTEVSSIYKKKGRVRKIHSLIVCPDLKTVRAINRKLASRGNIAYDGRPILGVDAKELLEICLSISPDVLFIPAHAWTPHFSVFGSNSGFDSIEECFDDLSPYIYAIETGLSSDPLMNWRISGLDRFTFISNSDAHSPLNLGREANVFETEISTFNIMYAIRTKKGFSGTIEFFPEQGKYHNDGHRICGINFHPHDTIENRYICPVCGRKLTLGVLHRVQVLSDRNGNSCAVQPQKFTSVLPLIDIISRSVNCGKNSRTVLKKYMELVERFGGELQLLLNVPVDVIREFGYTDIANLIEKMRAGNISITPGFDGEYGKIVISNG